MEHDFWHERWERDQITFHQRETNPLLMKYWPSLAVSAGRGVLVPLCGKSLDMRWLEAQGHQVWGVEISRKAIDAYFAEAGEEAQFVQGTNIHAYAGAGTKIYFGDYLQLSRPDVPRVGGVFDRGALVALPTAQRAQYADHIQRIIPNNATILLVTIEYDQNKVSGPPFSVPEAEVQTLYGERCRVELLERAPAGGLPPRFSEAGVNDVRQCVYRIVKER